jgi:hypothetical protein
MAKTASFKLTRREEDVLHLAQLKRHIEALQAQHDALERRLRRKLGTTSVAGVRFTVFDTTVSHIDHTKLLRLLGDKYKSCWNSARVRSSRLTQGD